MSLMHLHQLAAQHLARCSESLLAKRRHIPRLKQKRASKEHPEELKTYLGNF